LHQISQIGKPSFKFKLVLGPFHWRPIPYDSRSQTVWLHWLKWRLSHLVVVGQLFVRHKFWPHSLRLGPDQTSD